MESEGQPSKINQNSIVERRGYKRVRVRDNIYITFSSKYYRIGKVVDISVTGVSFEYLALNSHDQEECVEVDIFSNARGLYISRIPCRVVYDIRCDNYQSLIGLENRRCGLAFRALTEQQSSGLVSIINQPN